MKCIESEYCVFRLAKKPWGNTILCFNCERGSEVLDIYSDSNNGDKTDT